MAKVKPDGSIILSTQVDTAGIDAGTNSVKRFFSQLAKSAVLVIGTRRLIDFGKEAISLASDLEEVQNVVDVAFGSMSSKMEQFAETSIETFGLSKFAAKQTGSSYMAMAKGIGIADDVASDLALTLTGLSGDLASFYNVSQEDARTALNSIFTGETETLKRYGILITDVNLQEFAYRQGIKTKISAMNQQEKTMLRYQYVLEATSLAQGDFARTSDSWANKTRVLGERWKEVKTELGEAFKTIAVMVLPVIESVVKGFSLIVQWARSASMYIAQLFGAEVKDSNDIKSTTADTQNNIEGSASSMEDFADATKKTNKEAQKVLAPFDTLNMLTASMAEQAGEVKFDTSSIPTENLQQPQLKQSKLTNAVSQMLDEIMDIIPKALMAIGVILLAFGQIGWGIGFIIAGVATLAVSEASEQQWSADAVKQLISDLSSFLSSLMVCIGVILLAFGQIGWGLSSIIAGISLYNVTEIAVGMFDTNSIKEDLLSLAETISITLLALGVVVLFLGPKSIGLGMIVSGLVLYNVSQIPLEDFSIDAIVQKLQTLSEWIAIFLTALGVVLLLTTSSFATAIGMIIAGIALYNISQMETGEGFDVQGLITTLQEITLAVSTALLAIGTILLFWGASKAIAIGCIVAGVVGFISLAATDAFSTQDIIDTLSEILMVVMSAIVALGVVLMCTGQLLWGVSCVISGIAGLVTMATGSGNLPADLRSDLTNLLNIIGGFTLVLGVVLLLAQHYALGIGLIVAGIGAFGASYVTSSSGMDSTAVSARVEAELNQINQTAQTGIGNINNTFGQINLSGARIDSTNLKNSLQAEMAAVGEAVNESTQPIITSLTNISLDNITIDSSALCNQMSTELDAVNSIVKTKVEAINASLAGIQTSVNVSALTSAGSLSMPPYVNASIPKLATGTVIPPNREFLAILGDQKSGVNVEAPIATIEQAVSNAMARQDNGNGGSNTVVLEIDGYEFGRIAIDSMMRQRQRIGTEMVVTT